MNRVSLLALFVATILAGCSIAGPAFGQQNRPRRVGQAADIPVPQDETVSLEGSIVEVPVVVSDRSGRYIPSLTQGDFELSEDGVPQQIAYLRDERVPIHVAIVMDLSSSTRESLPEIQDAAVDFVGQLMPGDQIMVVSFNNAVRVEQGFTSDRKKLIKAIQRTQTEQGTKLYDAVYETVARHMKGIEGRKALVLLSDGEDTRSDRSFDEAVSVCAESDVLVYGIRYPGNSGAFHIPIPGGSHHKDKDRTWGIPGLPGIPKIPHIPGVKWPLAWAPGGGSGGSVDRSLFMETVTANSGGALYYANAVHDVRGLFARIAEELRHVYVLGYSPSNAIANGGYRKIAVEVPTYPDLAVRHRLGYQADSYK